MNFWKSAEGLLTLELTSADRQRTLRELGQVGIPLYHVENRDSLTVRFEIGRKDWKAVKNICRKRGDRLKILKKQGFFWTFRNLLKRPVLVLGSGFLLLLFLFLPSRVLLIRTEGNHRIPSDRILEAAEAAGVRFFVSGGQLRNEEIKNSLLLQIPELSWAGVNVRGSSAVISVREHPPAPDQPVERGQVASIVADRDGVVDRCTAFEGNLLCRPGQAVFKGQVLISGYEDCGSRIRAVRADGEIYARTMRDQKVVTGKDQCCRLALLKKNRVFSLIVGKKRIKIRGTSRNLDPTCGRMYEEYYITLPGGYRLPLALAVDTYTEYRVGWMPRQEEQVRRELSQWGKQCLLNQMVAGSVLRSAERFESTGDGYSLLGRYLCCEMIGRTRQERFSD